MVMVVEGVRCDPCSLVINLHTPVTITLTLGHAVMWH